MMTSSRQTDPPAARAAASYSKVPIGGGFAVAPLLLAAMLALHGAMLAFSAWQHSPVIDEVGHLPAGLSPWQHRRFDLYAVNPPLIRSLAVTPLLFCDVRMDWARYSARIQDRSEFDLGVELAYLNRDRLREWFAFARWACIPWSILGALVCYFWGRDLAGQGSGLIAAGLWCFSPNILGHASLMTPDAHAAAAGLAAMYAFYRWLERPLWGRAVLFGALMGLAQLTKFTWLVLFALYPLLWTVRMWVEPPHRGALVRGAGQLFVAVSFSLYLVNAGYLFEGSGMPLGSYEFASESLTGEPIWAGSHGNRFRSSMWGRLPVPFPRNFVLGIDQQKFEFERGYESYLCGEHRIGGWWYYYLYAMLVKMPLGTLVTLALVAVCRPWRHLSAPRRLDLIVLLSPAVAILVLVSSQTGFSHHLRYVLPSFPFLFVFVGWGVAQCARCSSRLAVVAGLCLAWSLASSLTYFPHGLSYFNELAGGPEKGWLHLNNSNIDWGQDLYRLKAWQDAHPQARPFYVAHFGLIDPKVLGIDGEAAVLPVPRSRQHSLRPGWYAVSLHLMTAAETPLEVFRTMAPADRIGYSMHIYYVE